MKFCPVVPEICRGQVHGPRKERRRRRIRIRIRIIIRNGAKTISLGDLTISPNNTYEKGINSLQNLGYPYLVCTSNTLNHNI